VLLPFDPSRTLPGTFVPSLDPKSPTTTKSPQDGGCGACMLRTTSSPGPRRFKTGRREVPLAASSTISPLALTIAGVCFTYCARRMRLARFRDVRPFVVIAPEPPDEVDSDLAELSVSS
jgi:hypothetical protein